MDHGKRLRVLFLCTGNSCRSQMAEGWARHLKSNSIDTHSAGVEPHDIDPLAVAVMEEVDVDISAQCSKDILELLDTGFDYVVTLCGGARETCPALPGDTRRLHVGFDDPPALAREARERGDDDDVPSIYRRVRDEIRAFIDTLPEGLDDPASRVA